MKPITQMTQVELAAFISTHLEESGIQVVLSGGATVCLYSNGRYVSNDLDFVNQYQVNRNRISHAMNKLGFEEVGRHFTHPETEFFVEFPPGPLMAGDDPITDIDILHFETGILRIISPTSCVKTRLAHFYHWGDRQCLQQAVMVAESHDVDMKEIGDWSSKEGKIEKFNEFIATLGRRNFTQGY
jgi:hypothetical protein